MPRGLRLTSKKKQLTLQDLLSLVDKLNLVSGLIWPGDDRYILTEYDGVIVPRFVLSQKVETQTEADPGSRDKFWRKEFYGRGSAKQLLTSMIHAVMVGYKNSHRQPEEDAKIWQGIT
tara:strand:+ start:5625 stop:5978 length:354 start_codon:yes stop_codon:yes gene_type:complete